MLEKFSSFEFSIKSFCGVLWKGQEKNVKGEGSRKDTKVSRRSRFRTLHKTKITSRKIPTGKMIRDKNGDSHRNSWEIYRVLFTLQILPSGRQIVEDCPKFPQPQGDWEISGILRGSRKPKVLFSRLVCVDFSTETKSSWKTKSPAIVEVVRQCCLPNALRSWLDKYLIQELLCAEMLQWIKDFLCLRIGRTAYVTECMNLCMYVINGQNILFFRFSL